MATFPKSLTASALVTVAMFSLLLFAGCGEDGPTRAALWGKVTWKGQPVPSGVVRFGPDASKGNSGPQGYAVIRDGVYDTRQLPGKGCVAGPHVVGIQGCTGQNISDERRYGDPLFAAYQTDLDVPAEGGEIDLIIPDSVKAANPSASEPE